MSIVGVPLFLIASTLLCVSIAAPGAAAIGAFRALPPLGIELAPFHAFAHGDTEVMGRIAAGFALEELFRWTTWSSTALAVVAGASWSAVMFARWVALRPWSARLALVALIVTIGAAAMSQFAEPALSDALHAYRSAARDGIRGPADEAKARFDSLHRRAESERQVQLIAALVAIAAGGAALVAPSREQKA